MKIIVCILVFTAIYGTHAAPQSGRDNVASGEVPFQVTIQDVAFGYPFHVCGGAIYDREHVVTAAHCFDNGGAEDAVRYFKVVGGDYDITKSEGTEQTFSIASVIVHEDYQIGERANDIALIKINGSFTFTSYVLPVNLLSDTDILVGDCDVTGWGLTTEDGVTPTTLQAFKVSLYVGEEECEDTYPAYNSTTMMCAGSPAIRIDSCSGMAGSPLTCYDPKGFSYFAGTVAGSYGCTNPNYPNVYTDALYFKQWISDNS